MILKIVCVAILVCVGMGRWDVSHMISGEASKELASGIRAEILNNIRYIRNPVIRKALVDDLNQPDDSKRVLTSIDTDTAADLFEIFQLDDPGCDKNGDHVVSGDELKCLGKIWKNFVPNG